MFADTDKSHISRPNSAFTRTIGGSAVAQALSLVGTFTLAAVLPISSFGQLSAALACSALISTLWSMSLDRMGVIMVADSDRPEDTTRDLLQAACCLSIAAAVCTFVAAQVLSWSHAAASLTAAVALGDVLRTVTADLPRLTGRHFTSSLLSQASRNGVAASVAALGALFVSPTVTFSLCVFAGVSIGLGALSVRRTRVRFVGVPSSRVIRVARQGVALNVASVSLLGLNQADVIVCAATLGNAAAGKYALAVRVANGLGTLVSIVNTATLPQIALQRDDDRQAIQASARRAATIAFYPVMLAAGLIFVGSILARGVASEVLRDASQIATILVVGQTINAATGIAGTVLAKARKTWVLAVAGASCLLFAIPLEVVFARKAGVVGLAWASSIGVALFNVISYVLAKRMTTLSTAPYGVRRTARGVRALVVNFSFESKKRGQPR